MRDVAVASVVLWDSDVAGYTGPVEDMNTVGLPLSCHRNHDHRSGFFVLPIVIQELRDWLPSIGLYILVSHHDD